MVTAPKFSWNTLFNTDIQHIQLVREGINSAPIISLPLLSLYELIFPMRL